jgi:hypothetical protein
MLEKNGVKVTKFIEGENGLSGIKIYNKTFDTDMMMGTMSIFHGDPDGVYHGLGRTGAIASKMTLREPVAQLLEEGRSISAIEKLGIPGFLWEAERRGV